MRYIIYPQCETPQLAHIPCPRDHARVPVLPYCPTKWFGMSATGIDDFQSLRLSSKPFNKFRGRLPNWEIEVWDSGQSQSFQIIFYFLTYWFGSQSRRRQWSSSCVQTQPGFRNSKMCPKLSENNFIPKFKLLSKGFWRSNQLHPTHRHVLSTPFSRICQCRALKHSPTVAVVPLLTLKLLPEFYPLISSHLPLYAAGRGGHVFLPVFSRMPANL